MNIEKFLIDENKTIIDAMKQLDNVAKKILFVTKDNKFAGTLTDGDIRRYILKNGNLEGYVKDFANYNPKYLKKEQSHYAKVYMRKHSFQAIPIVNDNLDIVDIKLLNHTPNFPKIKTKLPIVIMAGGLGTRLYPYTKILPKPLIPIGDVPIIEHIINRFNLFFEGEYHLIVNHKKNMIKAYFNEIEKDYEVSYVDEDVPLGTGGGLSLLKNEINSTFILSNCDILVNDDLEEIYKHHKKEQNLVTMVCSLKNIKIPYGVIETNEDGDILNMKEKPTVSFLTNTGVYIVEPEVIKPLNEEFIGFPTIIENLKNEGKKIGIYPINEDKWLDMGQLDTMQEMRAELEK